MTTTTTAMTTTTTKLEQLRDAIARAGAHWVAEETSISKLPPETRRGLLLPSPPTRKEVPMTAFTPPRPQLAPLPLSFDWRNVSGKNCVTSVKSQVGGTCVAFANTAAVESCVLREGCEQGNDDIDLSERFLVACDPAYPSVVAAFLQSTGLP